jgi:hypothetical protein
MSAGSQRHYRRRHVFVHCSQSLQSKIPIMIIEPAATTTEQIAGNSSRKQLASNLPIRVPPATTPAPVLWLLSDNGRNIGDLKQKFCA